MPRNFKYLGTSRNKYYVTDVKEQARAQWQQLYYEACRQEEKAKMIESENRRIMDEYHNKMRSFMSRPITNEEREAELSNYVILIERSLTKPNL